MTKQWGAHAPSHCHDGREHNTLQIRSPVALGGQSMMMPPSSCSAGVMIAITPTELLPSPVPACERELLGDVDY
jgi:hypothetical protein